MAEIDNSIEQLRTLQESYSELADSAVAYNEGKPALAAAITAKGIPASKNDSIRLLAEKAAQIQQTPVTFDADDYSAIVSGNGALYDIVKEGLAHIRGDYAAMVVGEFMKDADTIALTGADAYYTSDGDFYTSNTTHTWHDDDTKANRYVIYYYTNEGSDYVIGSTELCPINLSIIGRIGNIICQSEGRIENIYNGGEINSLQFGNTQWFGNFLTIIGVKEHSSGHIIFRNTTTKYATIGVKKISGGEIIYGAAEQFNNSIVSLDMCDLEEITGGWVVYSAHNTVNQSPIQSLKNIRANKLKKITGGGLIRIRADQQDHALRLIECNSLESITNGVLLSFNSWHKKVPNITTIKLPSLKSVSSNNSIMEDSPSDYSPNIIDLEVGLMETNLRCKWWNPTNVIAEPTKLATLNANIRNHIAAKVSDRTGQSALTFTVSTNLYNNLEQATKDAFTAKGWICAGA